MLRHYDRMGILYPPEGKSVAHVSDQQHPVMDAYGGMCFDYRREYKYIYFELFEMWRKCIIAGALVLLAKDSGAQVLVGLPVCIAYLSVLAYLRPAFEQRTTSAALNFGSCWLLWFVSNTVFVSFVFFVPSQTVNSDEDGVLQQITSTQIMLTIVAGMCVLARVSAVRLRGLVIEVCSQ